MFDKPLKFRKDNYEYSPDTNTLYINDEGMYHWKNKYDYDIIMDDFLRENLYAVENVIFVDGNDKKHLLRGDIDPLPF